MTISFKEYGNSLGTRLMGAEVRKNIEKLFDENQKICFDFSDVKVVSHSYADEVFGKLIDKYGIGKMRELTTFKNTNEFVAKTIIEVINN